MTALPAPVRSNQNRIPALDVVRGIAVLGILASNIMGMGQPMSSYGWPGGFLTTPGPWADELWAAQLVLIDGKFRALFTLLFGAGMVLFWRRALAAGRGAGLLARRLAWLAVFGLLHWALLWRGDILFTYAVAGLCALPFLSWPPHKQVALGLAGYLVGAALILAAVAGLSAADPAGLRTMQAETLAAAAREAAAMRAGSPGPMIALTMRDYLGDLPLSLVWTMFETLPLLLIGMGLIQTGLFDQPAGVLPQRRAAALWLVGSTLTAALAAWALPGGVSFAESLVVPAWAAFPGLITALGLIALLAGWGRGACGWWAQRFAAAGQCAFTNYIGTSALALIIFAGWGLGLFGKLGRAELYGVMLLFWAIMLAWPGWWLARFRHGPLEWLWRCLTYGRRVPLRR